ncbi:hypothetical protein [Ornithinimicrobium cavernae]|uniref:hypothetical protein n=1 Tax=Ornithinimicrobium cavernae TaxID=2666047 RepID=UPI0012B16A98|nr:hypothetical protein [Ornithinimicrobium cavernae]
MTKNTRVLASAFAATLLAAAISANGAAALTGPTGSVTHDGPGQPTAPSAHLEADGASSVESQVNGYPCARDWEWCFYTRRWDVNNDPGGVAASTKIYRPGQINEAYYYAKFIPRGEKLLVRDRISDGKVATIQGKEKSFYDGEWHTRWGVGLMYTGNEETFQLGPSGTGFSEGNRFWFRVCQAPEEEPWHKYDCSPWVAGTA